MYESLHNLGVNISNYLPDDTAQAAKENFLYNAGLNIFLTGSPALGVLYGVVGMVASYIDSVGNSLIRNISEIDTLIWYQDYTKKIIILGILKVSLGLFSININLATSLVLVTLYELYQGMMFAHKKLDSSSFVFITNKTFYFN